MDQAFPARDLLALGFDKLHPRVSIQNPMGYWCAPNGAGPDYVSSIDIHTFLGFGLMHCWVEPRDTTCAYGLGDLYMARCQFINTVMLALRNYPGWEWNHYCDQEPVEPRVTLKCGADYVNVDWLVEMVAQDGDVCFAWLWDADQGTGLWLSTEAINNREKRDACLAACADALKLLELHFSPKNYA